MKHEQIRSTWRRYWPWKDDSGRQGRSRRLPLQGRIVLVGHSHLMALADAHAQRVATEYEDTLGPVDFVQMLEPAFQPNVKAGESGLVLHEALECRIRAVLDTGLPVSLVVDCVGGNEYHLIGLVNHQRRFDFVLPSAPDLPLQPDAEIVPFSAMEATLRHWMEYALAVLGALRRTIPTLPMVHVQSPPPVADDEHIRANPVPFQEVIESHGVAPAAFRWKLWRMQSDIYVQACAELGITFLPTPAEALDADGFLAKEYWNPDPTHANAGYGALVLRQIEAIAQEREAT